MDNSHRHELPSFVTTRSGRVSRPSNLSPTERLQDFYCCKISESKGGSRTTSDDNNLRITNKAVRENAAPLD